MSFEERKTEFAGLPVLQFPDDPEAPLPGTVDQVAWLVGIDDLYHHEAKITNFDELFDLFLRRVDTTRVTALVIGSTYLYDEQVTANAVEALIEHAKLFPTLRAVFVGDILREEGDVAYITVARLNPLLDAFPELEVLGARGNYNNNHQRPRDPDAVSIQPTGHSGLRSLILESGGLDPMTIGHVLSCDLPNLEHLEFYLGEPAYGGEATIDDLAPLLSGDLFPKLRSLGLRDAVFQDEIAAALADAPITARLESLDLSLGTLGDEGVTALLAGQPLAHLKKLDLHHHYLTDEVMARVRADLPGVDVDLSDRMTSQTRYIAVAE